MGDFSRDPLIRLQDSLAKHYVGVRLQQGVPILDADWNELEDLRRHELASLFAHFFGDGVPEGNDGFRVQGLAAGGVGTIVLAATSIPETALSTVEIDFDQSTGASLLGFLPRMAASARPLAAARLTGNAAAPFALQDGLTLAVRANGQPAEVVTFDSADFADIGQATVAEVVVALNAGLSRATAQAGTGNDFIIGGGDGTLAGAGRLIADGVEVINEGDLTYTSQPLYNNAALAAEWDVDIVPALTTPAGADRQDLVYIDIWDREVDSGDDDAMVVPAVGVEATVRLREEWAIRVAEGATDLSGITRDPAHRYAVLARLERAADQDAVGPAAVLDQRVRNLNVAKYLKTPISFSRGSESIDAEDFASMLDDLREVLLTRLRNRVFDFSYTDDYNQFVVLSDVQDLAQLSAYGAVQARAGNFNNADALRFLDTLYQAQTGLVGTIRAFGNDGGSAQDFLDGYTDRLEGDAGPPPIPGLKPALDTGNLLASVAAQNAINTWLSLPVDVLPEGNIIVTVDAVEPTSNLAFNVPFNITYRIEAQLSSPRAQEAIDLSISTVASSTWNISLGQDRVVLDATGGQDTVVVTVTPRSGTVRTVFRLTGTAERNAAVSQVHDSDPFEIGAPPPTDVFLQWKAPTLDSAGRFVITESDLADATVGFQVQLVNTSDTVTQTFRLEHFVTPPAGEETAWQPVESAPASSDIDVAPDATETVTNTITGPTAPTVGAEGTLTVSATLIAEDGSPVAGGKSRTLEIPFVVVPG